jgi:hypothetical protein
MILIDFDFDVEFLEHNSKIEELSLIYVKFNGQAPILTLKNLLFLSISSTCMLNNNFTTDIIAPCLRKLVLNIYP